MSARLLARLKGDLKGLEKSGPFLFLVSRFFVTASLKQQG
jgi:hypothetical protein